MSDSDRFVHWYLTTRCDGAEITVIPGREQYQIVGPKGQTAAHCPCCGAVIRTIDAAKRIADELWPITPAATP